MHLPIRGGELIHQEHIKARPIASNRRASLPARRAIQRAKTAVVAGRTAPYRMAATHGFPFEISREFEWQGVLAKPPAAPIAVVVRVVNEKHPRTRGTLRCDAPRSAQPACRVIPPRCRDRPPVIGA